MLGSQVAVYGSYAVAGAWWSDGRTGAVYILKLAEDGKIVRNIFLSPEVIFLDLEDGHARKYDLITAAVLETGNNNDGTPRTLGTYASNMLRAEMKDLLVMAR